MTTTQTEQDKYISIFTGISELLGEDDETMGIIGEAIQKKIEKYCKEREINIDKVLDYVYASQVEIILTIDKEK